MESEHSDRRVGPELLRQQLASGPTRLRATGTSMRPLLSPSASVELEPFCLDRLRLGDIVCFENPSGHLILHRFLGREPGTGRLLTRGDWRVRFDPPVDPARVIARVRAASPSLWPVLDRAYVMGVTWPTHLVLSLGGRSGAELVARGALGLARLLRAGVWRLRRGSTRMQKVRPDWEVELVAGLCGLEPGRLVAALEDPDQWLCYLASWGTEPVGCLLCSFQQGACSLEALGARRSGVERLLLETLEFRLFGLGSGDLFALRRGTFRNAWSSEKREWLLDNGFVATASGFARRS